MKFKKKLTLGLLIFAILFLLTTAYYFFYEGKFINLTNIHNKGNLKLGEIFFNYNNNRKYNFISFKTLSQILWYGSNSLSDKNIRIFIIAKNVNSLLDGIYIYNKETNMLEKIKNTFNEKNSKIIITATNTDKKNYFIAGQITENILLGLIDNNINFKIKFTSQKIFSQYNTIAIISVGK